MADTYSAPSRNATPTGSRESRCDDADHAAPAARPRLSNRRRIAYTRPSVEPTNSVPFAPHVISRAPGTRATSSIANPGGSRSVERQRRCATAALGDARARPRKAPNGQRARRVAFANRGMRQIRRVDRSPVDPPPRSQWSRRDVPVLDSSLFSRAPSMNVPDRAANSRRHTCPRRTPAPRISPRGRLIRRLVGFDTTSRDSNLALIEWVRAYLEEPGCDDTTLTFDDDRRKANLFATLPARDGNATDGRHRALRPHGRRARRRAAVGHRPFEATLVGDRLHGRGVTDMKSFSAIGLAFVPRVPAPRARTAAAFRALVRRGNRLHRRAPADRRRRRARRRARRVHRRRADRHAARRRAQGQDELALPRARATKRIRR